MPSHFFLLIGEDKVPGRKLTLTFRVFCFFSATLLRGSQDLSSLTRNGALAVRAQSPNHWTPREFPDFPIFLVSTLAAHGPYHTDREL